MSGPLLFLLCFCCLAAWSPWPLPAARALPLCTDGRAPVALNMTLGFCSVYSRGSDSCCDAAADAGLRKRFEAMGVKDAACAAVVKSVLCAILNVFVVSNNVTALPSEMCSCNSDAGCDPSKLGGTDADDNAQPCQYQVVVSEYSTKLSSSNISTVASADPSEVRRIFTMGMPFASHYGGQILFGPTDGYLYLVIGDGGRKGDPFYFSQNKKSLLGKILRLDIDSTQVFFYPCYARYLYTDLYSSSMWVGTENPKGSGNYTTSVIPMSCSKNSPIACESTVGSPDPLLGYIFTFGDDNNKDIFLLTSKGIYRIVRPSLCGFTCPAEKLETSNGTTPPAGISSLAPTTRLGKPVAVTLAIFVCSLFS
ncbi:hypothetical protein PR202_ga13074 [Eleusine coracana subsp. coracana]|uniref:Glucose/Sorbosone dehydrogenase domain-containing protein n=1 Tax=Eleusine coracana subsp. coracana TaxID=191504 RepID=A0AAV5CDK7_ELECO|nr:hypothetical protein PR202_ga13074 [Eleusine coracana subsp. coracana]